MYNDQLEKHSIIDDRRRLESPAGHLPPPPDGGERPAGDIRHSKETAASLSSNQDFTRLVSVCAWTCIYDNC